jgi:hypothetical protein
LSDRQKVIAMANQEMAQPGSAARLLELIHIRLISESIHVVAGGCERTETEYRALYRAAGFELTRAVATPAPAGTTVLEGKPTAD